MRKSNPLVIAVLALVLLSGIGTGFWIILNPGESGDTRVSELDNSTDADTPDGNPLDRTAGNAPANNAGTRPDATLPDGPDTPDPGLKGPGTTPDTTLEPGEQPGERPQPEQLFKEYITTSTIHGRVTMKSDGRPAIGATVRVETNSDELMGWWDGGAIARPSEPEPEPASRPAPELKGEAVTDGAGEYTLTVTYKSWHAVTEGMPEEAEEWRQWDRDAVIVVASLAGYAPARSAQLRPTPDSKHEINLRLAIPAAITGRVIDAVTREGVAGARGQLQDIDAWRDGGSTPHSFTSDENGYFSLNALPASSYTLTVNAQGYAEYGGWEKGRVNLSGGGEKDLGEIPMLRSASVIGRVVDEGGNPLNGAEVQLVRNQQWGAWPASSALAGEDGRFELTEVEPGTYTLKATAAGLGTFKKDGVTIEPARQTDLGDLVVGKGIEVSGIVVDGADKPLAGAVVGLKEQANDFGFGGWGEPSITATTDAQGRFVLAGATEGSWELVASMESFATHRESMALQKSVTGLKIRLTAGGSVSGRVVNADGTPVAQTTVSATSQKSPAYSSWKTMPDAMWGMLFSRQELNAQTNDDGYFELKHVPEGVYLLAASNMRDGVAVADDISIKEGSETRDVVIRLPGKGTARITITENGVAVPDLKVSLSKNIGWGGQGNHTGFTDAMGITEMKDVPAGTWYVTTERDEGSWDTDTGRRRLTVREGETVEFKLELRPQDGVRLHGRLTLNGKAVFQDVMLLGTGKRADVMKNAKMLEGGFYEFVGLKTGTYVLHARTSDTEITARTSVNLDKEGDFPLDRDFIGHTVSGTVSTPENSPAQLASVSVSLQHAQYERPEFASWLRGRLTAGADGRFNFSGVTPGTYILTASLEGVGNVSSTITVAAADQTGLKLAISQNSGSIKLTIGKLNGTPVSGNSFAIVNLTTTEGAPVDLGEGFQGWFALKEGATQTIPTVQPGTYNLNVQGSGFIPVVLKNLTVTNGERTEVNTDLTAAAELHLTFTNPEITQAMIDEATVKYYDASGGEVPQESNVFDSWGAPDPPQVPTLKARYLTDKVTEVRVRMKGYAELVIPVQFEPGRKITKQESALAE